MSKQRRIVGSMLLIVTAGCFLPASAQQFNSFEDIRSQSSIFENRPTFDTTPFTFELGSVTYRVPRNYLVVLPPAYPTLKVTFPGFEPLSEATRDCFHPKRVETSDCATIKFLIIGTSAPGALSLTHAQNLESYLKNSPGARKTRVLDYDVYERGPENARSETYSDPTRDLFFNCGIDFTTERPERAICRDQFRLDDGNHAHFFFPRAWVGRVPEIETGIRKLMAGFVSNSQTGQKDVCANRLKEFVGSLDRLLDSPPRSIVPVMNFTKSSLTGLYCDIESAIATTRSSRYFKDVFDWGAGYAITFRSPTIEVSFGLKKSDGKVELPAARVVCGDGPCL